MVDRLVSISVTGCLDGRLECWFVLQLNFRGQLVIWLLALCVNGWQLERAVASPSSWLVCGLVDFLFDPLVKFDHLANWKIDRLFVRRLLVCWHLIGCW